jgi:hypothetical protein
MQKHIRRRMGKSQIQNKYELILIARGIKKYRNPAADPISSSR